MSSNLDTMNILLLEMYKDVKRLMERNAELEREIAVLRGNSVECGKKIENVGNDKEYDVSAMTFPTETKHVVLTDPKTKNVIVTEIKDSKENERDRVEYQREYQRKYREKKKQEKEKQKVTVSK
jgi:hypothetical protein